MNPAHACKNCNRISELEAELAEAYESIKGWRRRVAEQIERAKKAEEKS